jgi:hypothetical protein
MAPEDGLPLLADAAQWALDGAADTAAQQRTPISRAPLPGAPRPRVLEAVPEFAFLAMPEQDLDWPRLQPTGSDVGEAQAR